MDVAYDHIQEEAVSPEEAKNKQLGEGDTANDLNTEVREAYRAFSASPWGTKLGGLWGSVKKQGETYYTEARKEIAAASTEASKGITDLVNQTKTISLQPTATSTADSPSSNTSNIPIDPSDPSTFATAPATSSTSDVTSSVNSLTTDSLLTEAQSLLSRFQTVTSARLAQLSKAENAADEALERYGRNLRALLKDAVTVAPPSSDPNARPRFESKDAEGRRVVHATRFDAQLHVIHTRPSSFTADPVEAEGEYASWKAGFDAEKKTDDVAKDLDKYDELRRAMERLVPGEVAYKEFWTRYYFLRHVVEMEETRRRELVRGAKEGGNEEEVGWGDEEEDEVQGVLEAKLQDVSPPEATQTETAASTVATPQGAATPTKATNITTSTAPPVFSEAPAPSDDHLRPSEPRRSNEHSVADSDASYDILSAATSRGPGTPTPNAEVGARRVSTTPRVAEESEEEDWE